MQAKFILHLQEQRDFNIIMSNNKSIPCPLVSISSISSIDTVNVTNRLIFLLERGRAAGVSHTGSWLNFRRLTNIIGNTSDFPPRKCNYALN